MADESTLKRQLYISAFNNTMVKIWKEKIIMTGAVDTASLYRSVTALPVDADGKYLSVTLRHQFNLYGVYVDRGTGREVPVGNPGDTGRPKVRVRKPWFSKKYLSSILNLRDFYGDAVGEDIAKTVTEILSESTGHHV